MLSLLDIAERSQKGPIMEEKDWDLGLFRKMTDLVRKYEIRRSDDGSWFNTDDGLAYRTFCAAIDFLAETGIYCITTNRVIEFSEDEVLQAIHEAPDRVLMGEGRDARVFKQHPIEGREPLNFCPGHHAPFTEELAPLVVKNFAQIPRTDFIEGFNFTQVDGREIFGPPLEAYAARRQLSWMREGIRKAGRPGLAVVYYPLTTRAASLLAPMDPDYGLRRTDGVLLSVLPTVKVEHDLLTAAIVYQDYGCFGISGSFGMSGGFCGGVEGAIIEGIVKPIAAMLAYRDYINYVGVEPLTGVSALAIPLQPINWARSVVCQALNRHTHTICMQWVIPTAGPGTETSLLEVAIRSIEAPLNGSNLYAIRHSRAQINAGQTPLEAEWMLEVADATQRAGLTRETAGEILWKLAKKLEDRQPEPGFPITECYDLVHHRPSPEYERIYKETKEELASLGLCFE